MDTRDILSFSIKEQLKIVAQNTHEVKQRAHPHIAAESCERDSARQWYVYSLFRYQRTTEDIGTEYARGKTESMSTIAAASCERDSTRQWSHNHLSNFSFGSFKTDKLG